MSPKVEPYEPAAHLDALRAFAADVWGRRGDEDADRWRYADAPGITGRVAAEDGRLLAVALARPRTWSAGGARVDVQESFDWAVRPDCPYPGLGVLTMRRLAQTAPTCDFGGTADAIAALPAAGFARAGAVTRLVLPLRGRALRGRLQRLGPLSGAAEAAFDASAGPLLARLADAPPPRDGAVVPVSELPDALDALVDALPGVAPYPDRAVHRWLASSRADLGRYVLLAFRVGERWVGWTEARLWRRDDQLSAHLLHACARHHDPRLYRWLIGATVRHLASLRPAQVYAVASHPAYLDALRASWFHPLGDEPIWWAAPRRVPVPAGPWHVTGSLGDHPLHA